jgi:hypothetical protein
MTPFVVKNPRLTVTAGRRGTNQAVIRTDADGNVYPNSFGIIVKKFSDLPNGGYARQEGCFVDTDEDFEYFKQLNEHMFNRLVTNKPIIFPAAIAKGKAALPLRFAEWLQQQLLERFDIRSNINVNTNPGYSGYGLDLVGFADSNTNNIAIQLIDQLKASGINVLGKADMEKYLTENGKLDPVNTLQAIKENQEMQDIKAKALADGTFMKAPNGKDTNLTERQWLQVRTKNFINWFGDWENDPANASKIVDENGEPLVVYHSNDAEEFDSSRQYNWFSSKRQNHYGDHQYPVFLNIKNLFKRDEPTMDERAMITDYGTGDKYDKLPKEYDGAMVYHNTFGYYEILTTRSSNQIKSATDNIGTFSTENDDIQMFIGKKARTQFEYRLRKARPDMSDAEIKSTLDFLHSLEDNKENTAYIKAAIRWIANRSLTLPQDHTKAHQVFEIARKKHLDLQKYNTLGELIASPEMQPKEKEKVKFNPDEAKTFSNKRTVTTKGGRVFTVYDVENTEEGQREVCKAIAAHYKASPWCLSTFTSKGEPTESAKNHWNYYDSIPRKIAYENGKPVAFSSAHNMAKFAFRGMPVANNSKRFWFESTGDPMFATNEEINISQLQTSELLEQYKKDGLVKYDGTGNKYVWQNYSLTEKAIKELKEIEKDAWWDMEDSYPQDSLSDSIISDPNSIGSLRNVAGIVAEYLGLLGTPDEIDTLVEMQQRNIPLTEANYRSYVQGQREFIPVPVNPFPEEEIYDLPDDLPFFITPNGEVYGFVDNEGRIYLDETVISPEHPIHEYTHLWDRALAKNNPKLWEKGVKLMQEGASSLWNDIANSETYGKLWQSRGISGDKLTNLIASEVHARLVGVNGAKLLDQLAEEKGKANIIAKLK